MSTPNETDSYADVAVSKRPILRDYDIDQTAGAREIAEILMPHIRKGAIDVVIDLGCGEGEVLAALAGALSASRHRGDDPKGVLLIGLDTSAEQIKKAKARCKAAKPKPHVKWRFAVCDRASFPLQQIQDIRRDVDAKEPDSLDGVALICVGHTIFHLRYLKDLFQKFLSQRQTRPSLVLIDVYHTWDATLSKLAADRDRSVLEPREVVGGPHGLVSTRVLFTRNIKGNDDFVERGMVDYVHQPELSEQLIVRTEQLKWPSGKLVEEFRESGYVLAERTEGKSGYGEMVRFVFDRTLRTTPLPDLFIDSKTIPRTRHRVAVGHYVPHTASLHVIADWISEAGLIQPADEQSSRGFDFVIVEVSPWHNTEQGFRSLDMELMICGNLNKFGYDVLPQLLENYRNTLYRIQACNLGPFLHPNFAGYDGGNEWASAHFSVLNRAADLRELRNDAEINLYNGWADRLPKIILPDEVTKTRSEELRTLRHIVARIERNSTIDLLSFHETIEARRGRFVNRLLEDYSGVDDQLRDFRDISAVTRARDLELVQLLLHQKLRVAMSCNSADGFNTVLLGIPLRSMVDEAPELIQGLPERYRGGVWIFAGTSGEFGPNENMLLGDLARLTVQLSNSAIDARAADALEPSRTSRLAGLFSPPSAMRANRGWLNASRLIEQADIFDIDGRRKHHGLDDWWAWLSAWQQSPAGAVDPDLRDTELSRSVEVIARNAVSVATSVIKEVIDEDVILDHWTAILFLHCAKNSNRLSLLALTKILGVLSANSGFELLSSIRENERGYIRTNENNRMNAGMLLYAIYMFIKSTPEDSEGRRNGSVARVELKGSEERAESCELVFECAFDSVEARSDARKGLWAPLSKRVRNKEQTGNLACNLLKLAVTYDGAQSEQRKRAQIVDACDKSLRITFKFK